MILKKCNKNMIDSQTQLFEIPATCVQMCSGMIFDREKSICVAYFKLLSCRVESVFLGQQLD